MGVLVDDAAAASAVGRPDGTGILRATSAGRLPGAGRSGLEPPDDVPENVWGMRLSKAKMERFESHMSGLDGIRKVVARGLSDDQSGVTYGNKAAVARLAERKGGGSFGENLDLRGLKCVGG